MTLTLLSLSSIFQDFFDTPEDDPLLQDNDDVEPESSDVKADEEETSPHGSHTEKEVASSLDQDDSPPEGSDTEDAPDTNGDGMSSVPPEITHAPTDSSDALSANVPDGLSDNLMRHGSDSDYFGEPTQPPSNQNKEQANQAPKRTRKFVVPYNARGEDLEEVNDAVADGWSFRRIAVAESRNSVKPEGKKVIITLELNKPRTLFDF